MTLRLTENLFFAAVLFQVLYSRHALGEIYVKTFCSTLPGLSAVPRSLEIGFKSAEPYFYYAKALLEMSRLEGWKALTCKLKILPIPGFSS